MCSFDIHVSVKTNLSTNHEIWPIPLLTVHGPLETVLTGFHCTQSGCPLRVLHKRNSPSSSKTCALATLENQKPLSYLFITHHLNKTTKYNLPSYLSTVHTFMKLFCTKTRWFNKSVVKLCWKAPISADTYKCVLELERLRKLSSVSGGPSLVLTARGSLLTSSPCTWTGGSSTTVAGGIVLSADWTFTRSKKPSKSKSYGGISQVLFWTFSATKRIFLQVKGNLK